MEYRKNIQLILFGFLILMAIAQISSLPAPSYYLDDYPQGMREAIEEYELSGGPGQMVPRGLFSFSDQYPPMTRKSQRSSSQMRLRFGKRAGGFRPLTGEASLNYIPSYYKALQLAQQGERNSNAAISGKTDK